MYVKAFNRKQPENYTKTYSPSCNKYTYFCCCPEEKRIKHTVYMYIQLLNTPTPSLIPTLMKRIRKTTVESLYFVTVNVHGGTKLFGLRIHNFLCSYFWYIMYCLQSFCGDVK